MIDGTVSEHPRYMISVAAELVGMHPQTLRIYEQKGLVRPKRTAGRWEQPPAQSRSRCPPKGAWATAR